MRDSRIYQSLFLFILLVCSLVISNNVVAEWQWSNPYPQGNNLEDIAYSDTLNIYVAVGHNGSIVSSNDLNIWTVNPVGEFAQIFTSVVWANSKFVAVGAQGVVITSTNGINWTLQDAGVDFTLTKIYWQDGEYIVLGQSGNILRSADGIAWSSSSVPTGNILNGLASSTTIEVLVGGNGTILTKESGQTQWITQESNHNENIEDIVYGNGYFVAVSADGTILKSLDGITWESTTILLVEKLQQIKFSNGRFFGVGAYAFGKAVYIESNNAVDWSHQVVGENLNGDLFGVIWDGNQYIAVGERGLILHSSDATTWLESSSGRTQQLFDITHNDAGQYVAVGRYGTIIQSQTGLSDWVFVDSTTNFRINRVKWLSGQYVAVGESGLVLISPDGSQWIEQVTNFDSDLYDITFHDNTYTAVGSNGTVVTSADAQNWNTPISISIQSLHFIEWFNEKYVITGGLGEIFTSTDGSTWEPRDSTTTNLLYDVAWSGSIYIAVGAFNTILTSADAETWALQAPLAEDVIYSDYLSGILWTGNEFVVLGRYGPRGVVATSQDGVLWNGMMLPAIIWNGIWADNQLTVIGYNGEILAHVGAIQGNEYSFDNSGVAIPTPTLPAPQPTDPPVDDGSGSDTNQANTSGSGGGAMDVWFLITTLIIVLASRSRNRFKKLLM